MSEENKAGQEKKPTQNLCGDCVSWGGGARHCQCDNEKSDRFGGVVESKAAACNLFKHV